ncbi:MAG TPA: 3-hydroxyacyl-CoA dehydrogenase NAD-binding domain-containing protein [Candidatus Acidoferrales bacterium]|nr:3-hydroxyacyl-CoA dehydrogenase NAD-binding domain-containing protein [Candidatus Acidoferrales bacterium]
MKTTVQKYIGVVGAGRMGVGLAVDLALAGFPVWLQSRSVGAARAACDRTIDEVTAVGRLGVLAGINAKRAIAVTDGADSPRATFLVIECVPEEAAVKIAVLGGLRERFPEAMLATNTSSLSVCGIAEAIKAEDRTIGLHFLNPPYMFRVVEVSPGYVAEDRVSQVRDMLVQAGKIPIIVKGGGPGFVWNRLQFALLREALTLVETGVASASEVDRVVARGLAPRWVAAGPLATAALGGVEGFTTAAMTVLPTLSTRCDLNGLARAVAELEEDPDGDEASARLRTLAALAGVVPDLGVAGSGDLRRGVFSEIDHVGIAVRSIDRAVGWYESHLGLVLLHSEILEAMPVRLAYLDAGNVQIQLVEPLGPCKVAEFLDTFGEGLHHVCWAVDSIPDALRSAAVDRGPAVVLGGRRRRTCFLLEEPNRLRIELTEREGIDAQPR